MNYDVGVFTRRRIISPAESYFAVPAAGTSYTGPGDVVSSALGWWGLRAYSAATIGTNAIRLKESGGSTEQDFTTKLANAGGLDPAEIAAFKGANNLTVTALYDQTGNGRTLTPVTQEPTFTLAGLGSLPIMGFVAASGHALRNTSSITQSQPNTISVVVNVTNNGGADAQNILILGSTTLQQIYEFPDDTLNMYAGGGFGTAGTSGTWHALQCIFNDAGTGSSLVVDATPHSGSAGTDGISGTTVLLGARSGQNPTMSFVEAGLWGSAFNATQYGNMDANQSAYWGV